MNIIEAPIKTSRYSFPWAIENGAPVEVLRKRWLEGGTAAEICSELQHQFHAYCTRSSVIGKVHRLHLHHNGDPRPRGPKKVRKQARPGVRRLSPSKISIALEIAAALPLMPNGEDIPIEQRLSLLQLEVHTCRFPFGDPCKDDFFFCGGNVVKGLPYCAGHARLAFQEPEPHRRRR